MKKSLLLIFTLLYVHTNYAQIYTIWTEQTSGVTTELTSVSSSYTYGAWICGYSGVVLRTTNTGNNWISANPGGQIPLTLNLHNIFGPDLNKAFVCGSNGTGGYLFRTTNAGVNWSQVLFQPGGTFNAVWMSTGSNGFLQGNPVGNRWSLWKTTNGGANWDSAGLYLAQNGTETGWNNSFLMTGSSSFYFGTNNSRIYYSTNFSSWISQLTPSLTSSYSVNISNIVVLAGGDNSLLRSSNNGSNWVSSSAIPGSGIIAGIAGMQGSVWTPFWVARSSNVIYYTSDGGNTWSNSYTAPAGIFRHINSSLIGSPEIYAVRSNGGICAGSLLTSGVNMISNNTPVNFKLFQNYPNPFNPETKIRFDISGQAEVQLSVYDILGRKVTNIFKGYLKPGEYEINWNASGMASGIYYYKLVSDNYSEIRKMVLIK